MQDDKVGRCLGTQANRSGSKRPNGEWSSLPGALAAVRSLLAREALAATNSEMSEYYMAVIEDIEQEIARSENQAVLLPKYDPQGFLNAVATEMYMATRKRSQLTEDN